MLIAARELSDSKTLLRVEISSSWTVAQLFIDASLKIILPQG